MTCPESDKGKRFEKSNAQVSECQALCDMCDDKLVRAEVNAL